jgi:hypothetical protein
MKTNKKDLDKNFKELAKKFDSFQDELENMETQIKEIESRTLQMLERMNNHYGGNKEFNKLLKSVLKEVKKRRK